MQHYHICSPYLLFTVPWACILVINKCMLNKGIICSLGGNDPVELSFLSSSENKKLHHAIFDVAMQPSSSRMWSHYSETGWALPEQTSTVALNFWAHSRKTAFLHQLLKERGRNSTYLSLGNKHLIYRFQGMVSAVCIDQHHCIHVASLPNI